MFSRAFLRCRVPTVIARFARRGFADIKAGAPVRKGSVSLVGGSNPDSKCASVQNENYNWDAIVIGGGAVGSSTAYWLTKRLGADKVLVIEKDPSYRFASSALSATAIRQQFSTAENIEMCKFGADFLRKSSSLLSTEEQTCDVSFHEGGYLFLASQKGEPVMRECNELHKKHNLPVVLMSPQEVKAKYPFINVSDITLGSFGTSGEGWFDGYSLLMGFRNKARAQGARYFNDEVVNLSVNNSGTKKTVTGVTTKSGRTFKSRYVILASGAKSNKVSKMVGTEIPIVAKKRCIFVFECKDPSVLNVPFPFLCDPTGPYVRPEGKYFLAGMCPPEHRDPDVVDDFEVDHSLWEEYYWPTLAARVPAFEAVKVQNYWAGHYEMNMFDHNGILGKHPEVHNFYYNCGYSGHGLMESPASGRAASELLLDGKFKTIDLSAFRFERIAENKPVLEKAVI
eukprot:TRINITY_DN1240_c0_g2_i1.p1 TRINITY_DN1240_c0_g2~~TRINITY_DN1240_c0_g2_i1.p1  ORF type:complete len:454 (-),score=87.90 TRINITY_DN1240_c0_g2_i1:108-1469(-)